MKVIARSGLVLAMALVLGACGGSSGSNDANSGGNHGAGNVGGGSSGGSNTGGLDFGNQNDYHQHFYTCANASTAEQQADITRLCGIHNITFAHDGQQGKLQIFGSGVDYTPILGHNPGVTHFEIMMPNNYGMGSDYKSYYNNTVRYYNESFTTTDARGSSADGSVVQVTKDGNATVFTITREEEPYWPYAGRILELVVRFTPGASPQQDTISGSITVNGVEARFSGKGEPFRSNSALDYLIPSPAH